MAMGYLQIFKISQYKQLKAFWDELELGIRPESQGILMLLLLHMLTVIWTRYITTTFWRETVWYWVLLFPFVRLNVIRGTIREYLPLVLKCVHLEHGIITSKWPILFEEYCSLHTIGKSLCNLLLSHCIQNHPHNMTYGQQRENIWKKTTTFALLFCSC